ncbi:hypothetical protein BJ742DRAFT_869671 [Cladochytrium replicatum]|nr:hypothetical protein BJ742DRAFT_869671 [Cladochytrium replicatum]
MDSPGTDDATATDAAYWRLKYLNIKKDADATSEKLLAAESSADSSAATVAHLSKLNARLSKDVVSLDSKLAKELASIDALRAEWAAEKAALSASLKELRASNRELVLQLQYDANNSTANPPTDLIAKLDQIDALKDKNDAAMKSIAALSAQVERLTDVREELSTQLAESESKLARANSEIADLKDSNMSLMNDNESYQVLLLQKTASGEFISSDIMTLPRSSKSSAPEPSLGATLGGGPLSLGGGFSLAEELGGSASPVVAQYQKKNEDLETQLKALNLFIRKMLPLIHVEDVDRLPPRPMPPSTTKTPSSSSFFPSFTTTTTAPADTTPAPQTPTRQKPASLFLRTADGALSPPQTDALKSAAAQAPLSPLMRLRNYLLPPVTPTAAEAAAAAEEKAE